MITDKNKEFLARYGSLDHVDEQVHRFANDPNRHVSHEAKITIASRKNK